MVKITEYILNLEVPIPAYNVALSLATSYKLGRYRIDYTAKSTTGGVWYFCEVRQNNLPPDSSFCFAVGRKPPIKRDLVNILKVENESNFLISVPLIGRVKKKTGAVILNQNIFEAAIKELVTELGGNFRIK